MPRLQAQETLQRTGGAGLSTDEYFDLALAATGSKFQAQEMARKRAAAMMRQDTKPE